MIPYIKTPTIEDQRQVLQMLEDEGYRWVDKTLPTEWIPMIQNINFDIIYLKDTQRYGKALRTGRHKSIPKNCIEIRLEDIPRLDRHKLLL